MRRASARRSSRYSSQATSPEVMVMPTTPSSRRDAEPAPAPRAPPGRPAPPRAPLGATANGSGVRCVLERVEGRGVEPSQRPRHQPHRRAHQEVPDEAGVGGVEAPGLEDQARRPRRRGAGRPPPRARRRRRSARSPAIDARAKPLGGLGPEGRLSRRARAARQPRPTSRRARPGAAPGAARSPAPRPPRARPARRNRCPPAR